VTLLTSEAEQLRAHYQGLYKEFGGDHRAVQWSSRASQAARFGVLAEYVDRDATVLDVGAGLGDFLEYLRAEGHSGAYHGVDLVPEFTAHARKRFVGDARATFETQDILASTAPKADFVVASGLFNNRLQDNWTFLTQILGCMFGAARKAVVFNAISTYVDYQEPHLFYVDPLRLFDYAKRNLTNLVVLRHDYLVKVDSIPFEFVMVLRK
jgi:SAM-dependent methyltransferase